MFPPQSENSAAAVLTLFGLQYTTHVCIICVKPKYGLHTNCMIEELENMFYLNKMMYFLDCAFYVHRISCFCTLQENIYLSLTFRAKCKIPKRLQNKVYFQIALIIPWGDLECFLNMHYRQKRCLASGHRALWSTDFFLFYFFYYYYIFF